MTVSPHTSPVKGDKGEKEEELTKVLYGVNTVINTVIQFLNRTTKTVYACVDQTRPILSLDILALKKALEDAKKRGVKLMYLTEITKNNLSYCKQLMKIASELRHLDCGDDITDDSNSKEFCSEQCGVEYQMEHNRK